MHWSPVTGHGWASSYAWLVKWLRTSQNSDLQQSSRVMLCAANSSLALQNPHPRIKVVWWIYEAAGMMILSLFNSWKIRFLCFVFGCVRIYCVGWNVRRLPYDADCKIHFFGSRGNLEVEEANVLEKCIIDRWNCLVMAFYFHVAWLV